MDDNNIERRFRYDDDVDIADLEAQEGEDADGASGSSRPPSKVPVDDRGQRVDKTVRLSRFT